MIVTDRLGENGGEEEEERGKKKPVGEGAGEVAGGGWGARVMWAGMQAGWKEDFMNVDHCPST